MILYGEIVFRYHLQGRTCSVVRRNKLLVHQYIISLQMDHPGVILVTRDLGSPSDQYELFSQRQPISFNGKRHCWSDGSRNKYDPVLNMCNCKLFLIPL